MKRNAQVLLLAMLGGGSPALAQVEIGVSEWVSPTAWGTAPGADRREVEQFAAIVEDERIETEAAAAADFVFENGSRVLVGPDCEVVLDETFYDPDLDDVASMDVYADTVCVIRAGAGGETLMFETPVATVTVSEASATVVYYGAQADLGTGASLHLPASGPGALPRDVDLAVFFESGLRPGGDSFVEVRSATGRVAVLRRPGFMAIHATPGGLGAPERSDPSLLGNAVARLAGTGQAAAPLPSDRATAPSPVEVYSVLEGPERPGLAFEPCAVSDFCDAETVVTPFDFSPFITWPFP